MDVGGRNSAPARRPRSDWILKEMPVSSDELLERLRMLGIDADTHQHAPVATVEEMMEVCGHLPGAHTKNLFLRDAKKAFFLVAMLHDTRLDLKSLRSAIGARGNLSFASAEALAERLGVASGAVSPLAVVNDADGLVRVCLEDRLMAQRTLNMHPLSNARTTTLAPADLERFLVQEGHPPLIFAAP